MIVSFAVPDEIKDQLDSEAGKELVIDIKRYSEKRSLNANAYFWKLCDEIAKLLGSDKDTIYLLQLSKYGCFVDIEIPADALIMLKEKFRYVIQHEDAWNRDGIEMITARCYFGSSSYSKKEMGDLIDGTVRDCHDLGINTWTQDEINRLVEMWKG